MEPLSTTAIVSKLAESKLIEANAIKNSIENNSVAPLGIVASTTLADIQFQTPEIAEAPAISKSVEVPQSSDVAPTKEIRNVEYAGLLNGMLDAEQNLAGWGG